MSPDELLACADYRSVLRGWLGAEGRTQAVLARRARVSRSMVSMVLGGERELPLSQARAWGGALGLDGDQLAYFEALVRAEGGETLDLRRAARMHVAAARAWHGARRLGVDAQHLLAKWYVPALIELAQLGRLDDAASAAGLLWPEVEPAEVERAIGELVDRGVLVGRADGGYTIGTPHGVVTERDVPAEVAEAVRTYHEAQLEHARLAMRVWPAEVRHLGSLVVSLAPEAVAPAIEALHRFHLSLSESLRPASSASRRLFQISVQLFPRTVAVDEER